MLDVHGWLQGKRIDLNKQIRGLEGATGSTAIGRGRASGRIAQDRAGTHVLAFSLSLTFAVQYPEFSILLSLCSYPSYVHLLLKMVPTTWHLKS